MAWLHAVIDVPAHEHAAAAQFWERVLGWPLGPPWEGHPELSSFEPPEGAAYVHLQRTDGPRRVHVDVEVDDPDAAERRAVELGAERVAHHDRWRTLRSPGGLLFCLLRAGEADAPEAVTWPEGHRSRMVQVCIDAPQGVHDREVEFWRTLLGGRFVESQAREFAGKWHDDAGSPLQLLFQRLDEEEGPVRAHLDHGTDDLSAEVRRVLALGATDVGAGHGGWHVLKDDGGMTFCVTANPPERMQRRDIG